MSQSPGPDLLFWLAAVVIAAFILWFFWNGAAKRKDKAKRLAQAGENARLQRERDDKDAHDLQQRVDAARQRDADAERKDDHQFHNEACGCFQMPAPVTAPASSLKPFAAEPQDPGGVKARAALAKVKAAKKKHGKKK